jgi:hypothetical protein
MLNSALIKAFAAVCLFTLIVVSTLAQSTTTTSPVRDPQAIATFQSAISALGGVSAAAAIQDFSIQGTEEYAANPDPTPATFTWLNSGVEFSFTVQNANGTYTALSGHGTPAQLKHGSWIPLPPYVARSVLALHNPVFVLYTELLNQNYSLQYVGAAVVDNKPAIQIHTADNSDATGQYVTRQEWYFDLTSFLPVRVEYKIPDERNVQGSTTGSEEFSNYQSVSGLVVPYQITIEVLHLQLIANVTSVIFNSGLPPSIFNPPAGSAQ